MASQAVGFGTLGAGAILLTMGITNRSVREVLAGKASSIKPSASTSVLAGPPGTTGPVGGVGTVGAEALPQSKAEARSLRGLSSFDGVKVAAWIVPFLAYGRAHGWKGTVTSGFRSLAEQTRIYNSGVRPAAPPGSSNHEGRNFPRGAVDVTDAAELAQILSHLPFNLLRWAGSKDPVHFSFPHGGSY